MNIERIRVKVCGMRDEKNIMAVAQLLPHYMGFIFYAPSPRYVGDDFKIPAGFPLSVKRVGVFVNATTEVILRNVGQHALDFVQLHGHESVAQCAALKHHDVKVIKVFSVDDDMDFSATKPYAPVVDFFLFDTRGKYFGGNATTFNWDVLKRYEEHIPYFLSGGLTPDNIGDIRKLENSPLHAVDVNSGVEEQPALKDINKVKAVKATLNLKD